MVQTLERKSIFNREHLLTFIAGRNYVQAASAEDGAIADVVNYYQEGLSNYFLSDQGHQAWKFLHPINCNTSAHLI